MCLQRRNMEGLKTDVSAFVTDKKRSLDREEQASPKRFAKESSPRSCHPVCYEPRAQGTEEDISLLPAFNGHPSSLPIPSLPLSHSRRNLRVLSAGEDDSCPRTSSPVDGNGIPRCFQPSSSSGQTVASPYLIYPQNHERGNVRDTPELQYRLPGVYVKGSPVQIHEQWNGEEKLMGRGRGSCGTEREASLYSRNELVHIMNQEAEDLLSPRTQLQHQAEKSQRDRFNLSRYQLDDEEAVANACPVDVQFMHQPKQKAGKPQRDRFNLSRYQLEDQVIAPGSENFEDESKEQLQQQVQSSFRDRFNLSRYQLDDEVVGPGSENVEDEFKQHLQLQLKTSPRDRFNLSRCPFEEEVVAPGSEKFEDESKQHLQLQVQSPPRGKFSLSRYQPEDKVVDSKPGPVKHQFKQTTEEREEYTSFNSSRSQLEGGTVLDARIVEETPKDDAFPSEREKISQFEQQEGNIAMHDVRKLQTQSNEGTSVSSRDRLQNFRQQQAGKVVIPETWEGEKKLHTWVHSGDVEEAMRPLGLLLARAALVSDSVDYTKRAKASSSRSSSSLSTELAA